jgi:hypothetical protein
LLAEQAVDGAAALGLGHFDAAGRARGAPRASCGIVKKPISPTKAFGVFQPMIGPLTKL